MATQTRFVLNRVGMRALMRGEALRAYLGTRGEAVAAIAQSTVPHIETGRMEMVTLSDIGSQRARAVVIANHPSADAIEAKYRWLTHATEAAGLEVNEESPGTVGRKAKRAPSSAVASRRRSRQDAANTRTSSADRAAAAERRAQKARAAKIARDSRPVSRKQRERWGETDDLDL